MLYKVSNYLLSLIADCVAIRKEGKQTVEIIKVLFRGADILILDEPTSGLDPVSRDELLEIFLRLACEGVSILFSTHITSDLEKIADCVTFIDKGHILLTGYKDEILESHAVIKCSKEDYSALAKEDFVSARLSDFGAEVMVADVNAAKAKYSGLTFDKTTLEEIMLFYVNREKKEWS